MIKCGERERGWRRYFTPPRNGSALPHCRAAALPLHHTTTLTIHMREVGAAADAPEENSEAMRVS